MKHHISKHLEVREKYSAACVLSTLFSVFGNVVKYGFYNNCLIPRALIVSFLHQ